MARAKGTTPREKKPFPLKRRYGPKFARKMGPSFKRRMVPDLSFFGPEGILAKRKAKKAAGAPAAKKQAVAGRAPSARGLMGAPPKTKPATKPRAKVSPRNIGGPTKPKAAEAPTMKQPMATGKVTGKQSSRAGAISGYKPKTTRRPTKPVTAGMSMRNLKGAEVAPKRKRRLRGDTERSEQGRRLKRQF